MFLSLILIIAITAGGFGVTYLLTNDRPFMWRLAAGNVIGSAVFGLLCFVMAKFFGFSLAVLGFTALLAAVPLLIVRSSEIKKIFRHDWDKAKGRTERFTVDRLRGLFYYLFFLILFVFFFDRAMIVTDSGIFTGATNNLGDLPFHLGAIYGFADANNFLPENPSYAGAKFTYPFIADLLSAALYKLGMSVKGAMLLFNVAWAFSLLVILERFTASITGNRLAGRIAPFLLFLSGGLGFAIFFRDYWQGTQGIFEILWNLPKDYTIGDQFRWGNTLVTLFITQRSILLGMPIALIVIHHLWELMSGPDAGTKDETGKGSWIRNSVPSFCYGLIAGTLPLIHAHSLFVLFVVSAFLLAVSLGNWRRWAAFALGTALMAIPWILWILSGSATDTSEFLAWHFGFDSRGANIFWFWVKNTGLFVPAFLAGLLIASRPTKADDGGSSGYKLAYVWFAVPFVFLFVVSNLAKFAPWEWDNIKVLIFWFVGTLPFAAYLIAWIWERKGWYKFASAVLLLVLITAGTLDVWRTVSAQMKYQVFERDAVELAEEIRDRTEKRALILNAPTYNTAAVLTGRPSFMRYTGHLSSHGIDYEPRETDLKKIYAGEATADILLKKYGIDYVLVSPLEKNALTVNEAYFQRHELFLQSGDYKLYRVNPK